MLVVRSQDKKKLVVDDVVYVTNDYGNGWNVYCDKVSCQEGFIIARYSTEEKAIKVLDMLEAFVNDDKALLHYLGYKQCIITDYSYVNIRYKLKSLSFQFPQDDEVKE